MAFENVGMLLVTILMVQICWFTIQICVNAIPAMVRFQCHLDNEQYLSSDEEDELAF